jgi:hypothetical protein
VPPPVGVLPPSATAPPASDGTGSELDPDLDWIVFLFLFRDSISILFCIEGVLCKKIGLVCNLSAEEGLVCKKLDLSHI